MKITVKSAGDILYFIFLTALGTAAASVALTAAFFICYSMLEKLGVI